MYEGKIVTAGDVIGYLGMTGYSSEENKNNISMMKVLGYHNKCSASAYRLAAYFRCLAERRYKSDMDRYV